MKMNNNLLQYVFNNLAMLDQGVNVILLGSVDETISSRLGRAMRSGSPKWFVPPIAKTVNFIFNPLANQDNHIVESIEDCESYQDEIWSWIQKEPK